MISYLEGEIQKVLPDSAVVLVGGVGYQVYLPQRDLKSLQEGERKAFYTFLNLKQNGVELYGFAQSEERELFKELISLAQVGPRTALAILSVFRLKELREVVAREDAQALARVPGLGPKTARRILQEMKERLEGVEPLEISADSRAVREKKDLAAEALASLGYSVSQAREVVQNLRADFESLSVEEIVRLALSKAGGGIKS